MSALTEKKIELKYTDEISRLRAESSFYLQQCGSLQQQLHQVHNLHLQMKEHFWKEAQEALDEVVAKAAKRDAQVVAGIQVGTAEPLLKQQLEHALGDVETAQQELENWKGHSLYWEDTASQAQKLVEELTERFAAFGRRSGAETLTFSEQCASLQNGTSVSRALSRMIPTAAPAPSGGSGPGASRPAEPADTSRAREPRQDDDELHRSFSSDDEDRKRSRRAVKPLVLDPILNAAGFRRWQFNLYVKVCEASKHDSTTIMKWIQEVENKQLKPAYFEIADKHWDDLDVVFAAALLKVVNPSLQRDITIHQENAAQVGQILRGRVVLWYVNRQYDLSAAATHIIHFQSFLNLQFTGDLEGFMQAWDTLIIAISLFPCPDLLHSLFEPQLRPCKQLQPAFAVLDGNELLSNADQLKFLHNSGTQVVENMKAERTKQERMRAA